MEARKYDYTPIPTSKRFKDITKNKYGMWTVLGHLGMMGGSMRRWHCRCKCGKERAVHGSSLLNGTSTGCGCVHPPRKHGMCKSSEYRIRSQMINRCYNPKCRTFKHYGGRNIRVCKRWLYGDGKKDGFQCFYEDMGPRPEGLTIHRVNNDGNYEPSNCVWATQLVQVNESRHNNMLTWKNKTQSLANWAREMKMPRSALSNRINKGKWSVERALTTPVRKA